MKPERRRVEVNGQDRKERGNVMHAEEDGRHGGGKEIGWVGK